MHKPTAQTALALFTSLVFLLIFAARLPAAPASLSTGQIFDLNSEQLAALKQQPGICFVPYAPEKIIKSRLANHVSLQLPSEMGGGFLLGTPAHMAAALASVGATATGAGTAPVATAAERKPPAGLESTFVLRNSYRRDDLKWNIAGDRHGRNPNILSELKWEDLEIYQLQLQYSALAPRIVYLKASVDYGWIFDGDNRDSDYLGNNRTLEFSRSENSADDGHVWDTSAGIGYPFKLGGNFNLGIRPLIGYCYREQHLKISNGFQKVSTPGLTPPPGPIKGLHSRYDTQWYGPWIGTDLAFRSKVIKTFIYRIEANFSYEYHWFDYRAAGNWNLRQDLDHPKSFEHRTDGTGSCLAAGISIFFNPNWALNLNYNYLSWKTDEGTNRVNFADGTHAKTQLNEVRWKSYALGLAVVYRF